MKMEKEHRCDFWKEQGQNQKEQNLTKYTCQSCYLSLGVYAC